MNAEKWNADLAKTQKDSKSSKKLESPIPETDSTVNTENSVTAHLSSELKRAEETVSVEVEPAEKPEESSLFIKKAASKNARQLSTDEVDYSLRKRSSLNSLKARKRGKGSSKKWLLILFGMLISTLSGIVIYTWLTGSDNGSPSSVAINDYEGNVEYSNTVETVFGEMKIRVAPGDDLPGKEGKFDNSNELLASEMTQDETPLEGNGIVEDSVDDVTVKKETLLDKSAMAILKSQNESNGVASLNDVTYEESKPLVVSENQKDISSQGIIMEKEDSEGASEQKTVKIISQLNAEKSPEITREDKHGEKVIDLSQHMAIESPADNGGIIVSGGDVQSKKDETEEKIQMENQVIAKSGDLNEDRSRIDKNVIPAGTVDSDHEGISEKSPAEMNKEQRVSSLERSFDSGSEDNRTEENGEGVPVEEGSSKIDRHLPEPDDRKVTGPQSKTTVETALVISNQKKTKTIYSDIRSSGEQPDTTDINEGKHTERSSVPEKETVKAGTSPFLKEMSANYDEHFNNKDNHWPEFNNSLASALIISGAYHVEHKSQKGAHAVLHPDGIPNDSDFMIHISVNAETSKDRNAYGFIFGAKDGGNSYSFQIRNDNQYGIEKMDKGSVAEITGGPIDNIFIRRNSRKTLKIVKQKSTVRFYINDLYVDEIRDVDFPGNKIGFLVKGEVKISVDWIRTQIRFRNSL
jgi:hypothetical protein